MKKVMIPKIRLAFNSRREENIFAHEFARKWIKEKVRRREAE
jgi:hypothetical protein